MPQNSLTVYSLSGLSNRLKVLTSGMAAAHASGRTFSMLWPLTAACNCPYEDLFEFPKNVQTITARESMRLGQLNANFQTLPDILSLETENIELGYVSWLLNPGLYPQHARWMHLCEEYLLQIKPNPHLHERIQAFKAEKFKSVMIGVHLRRGDFHHAHPDVVANTGIVMQHVDEILSSNPQAGIFLCTDDGAPSIPQEHLQEKFHQRYGNRLTFTVPRSLDRNSKEAIQDALVDLYLLRETDYFIGTQNSSFSELAVYARNVPHFFCAGQTESYKQLEFWARITGLLWIMQNVGRIRFGKRLPFKILWNYFTTMPNRLIDKLRRYG